MANKTKAKIAFAFLSSSLARPHHNNFFRIGPFHSVAAVESALASNFYAKSLRHRHPRSQLKLGKPSGWLDPHLKEKTSHQGLHQERIMKSDQNSRSSLLQKHLERLRSSPAQCLILDGGTGEELFLRGVPDDRKIWSATAIVHPEYNSVVKDVHESFIDAGSDALTTNSYGIVPGVGFKDGKEVTKLMDVAGKIARDAASSFTENNYDGDNEGECSRALVLGSLGPLVESYRADLIMNRKDGVKAYLYAIEGLYAHVDVFLAETMSCLEEVCQVVDALSSFYAKQSFQDGESMKRPLLVSFTLDVDGKVRSGESVVEVIPKLVDYATEKRIELIGVMFNCCEPESITKALKEIQSNTQIHCYLHHPPHAILSTSKTHPTTDEDDRANPKIKESSQKIFLGAYANRLTPVDPNWTMESSTEAQPMRDDLSPEKYWKEFVRRWHDDDDKESDGGGINEQEDESNGVIGGIQLIGGCCGIGPDYIACLKKHLSQEE